MSIASVNRMVRINKTSTYITMGRTRKGLLVLADAPTSMLSNGGVKVAHRLPTIGGITLATLLPIDDTAANR